MTQVVQSGRTNDESDSNETPENSDTIIVAHLENETQIRAAFAVMQQLRPHLLNADDMLERVQRMQQNDGYRMLAIWNNTDVIAIAGYRLQENLIYGPFLYVDDLVTLDTARGQRCGARLLQTLQTIGIDAGCARLVLDTGLANSLAQRFYFRQGLLSTGLHFGMTLPAAN
jgi:ribosomal protein S18 acetylase RimI-like enzyme